MRNVTLLAVSCFCFVGCSVGGGVPLALDQEDNPPTIFVELAPGMTVRLADAEFAASSGWLESFSAQVVTDSGKSIPIKVKVNAPAAGGKRPTYVADADGKAIPSLKDLPNKKLVGFTLKELGGVVLYQAGTIRLDIATEFSYTADGRRQLAQQTFTHEDKSYEITYADYNWQKDGRLSGYSAKVVKAQ